MICFWLVDGVVAVVDDRRMDPSASAKIDGVSFQAPNLTETWRRRLARPALVAFLGRQEFFIFLNGFNTHRIHVWYICEHWGFLLMVNVTIYDIHGSYGIWFPWFWIQSLYGLYMAYAFELYQIRSSGTAPPSWAIDRVGSQHLEKKVASRVGICCFFDRN